MAAQKNQKKSPRRRFSTEFKPEALGLAEQVGVAGAAKQLGLQESQLHGWRKKDRFEASRSETEKEPAIANARLKRQLAKWTGEGWLYLAVVLELFSRMVVGRAMDKRMKAKLDTDALQMALWRRRMPKGVIVHSDRGSQYYSKKYQALIKKQKLICSMSAKGNPYDNAF